jgi:hypothetical protein
MNNTNSRSRLNVTTTNKDTIVAAADTDVTCNSINFFSMQQQQQHQQQQQQQQQIIQLEGLDRTITLQLKHLEFHHQEILKQGRPKPKPIPIKATTNSNKKKIAVTTMNSIMVPPPDSNTSSHHSFIKWESTNPLYDDDIKLIASPRTSGHRHRHRVVNRTMDVDTNTGEDAGEDENDYYDLVFQRECVA